MADLRVPFRRPRTLLVEDDSQGLDSRRELLRHREVEVVPATSRKEAVGRLQALSFRIDALLTDLNLADGGSELGGVEIAELIADHSGRSIPAFAYSGDVQHLPPESRAHFTDVRLKGSRGWDASRKLLDETAAAASQHLGRQVAWAVTLLEHRVTESSPVSETDIARLRDLISGAVRRTGSSFHPDAVGVLELPARVSLPYVIGTRTVAGRTRCIAALVGHEYLFGYGADEEEAAGTLRDALVGMVKLVDAEDGRALGSSKRLRQLIQSIAGLGTVEGR